MTSSVSLEEAPLVPRLDRRLKYGSWVKKAMAQSLTRPFRYPLLLPSAIFLQTCLLHSEGRLPSHSEQCHKRDAKPA